MAEYKIQGETLTAIADAIRAKTGGTATMTPEEMATVIDAVNLSLQEKSVLPSEEVQTVTPDSGYYGLFKVTVGAVDLVELPSVLDYTFGSASGMESAFSYSDPDATPGLGADNQKELGWKIVPSEAIALYGFRAKNWMSANSTNTFTLWDSSGNIVHQTTVTLSGGWNDVMLDAPINLFAGEQYTISTSRINARWTLSSRSKTSAKLSSIAPVYGATKGTYPSANASYTWVFTFYIGPSTDNLNPSEYEVTKTKMDELADEVKRISGATENITFEQILTALQSVPVQTA